jgi:3-oxoacyl-[acyl-carrier protein] reductase
LEVDILRVAVVTGASRGLGREIASMLGGNGYNVAINYLDSEKGAKEVATKIGKDLLIIKADVGNIKEVEIMRLWQM